MLNLYQVEFTNFCNLKCSYCPHPRMTREKGHISEKTLSNVIPLCHGQIVAHHFGEFFLHPQLEARMRQVAEANLMIKVSTNAVLLERNLDLLFSIPTKFEISISAHNWVNSNNVMDYDSYEIFLKRLQALTRDTNVDLITGNAIYSAYRKFIPHKWTDGEKFKWDYNKCFFIRDNYCSILWNGDIVTCCADYDGGSSNLNVNTDISELPKRISRPWSACDTCTLMRTENDRIVINFFDYSKICV